ARFRSAPPHAPASASPRPERTRMDRGCRSSWRPQPSRPKGAQTPPRRPCETGAGGDALSRAWPYLTSARSAACFTVPQALPDARRGLLRGDLGFDGNIRAPIALGCKLDAAVRQCEQRVVRAHADIGAGMPLGAALARQDVAGQHVFATVLLDAEPAPRGI